MNGFTKKIDTGDKNGFIALMSVLIIGITLLGITFTASTDGFFSRFATLDSEYKRISLGLAESCVNTALLKIAQDYNYNPTDDPAYSAVKGGVVVEIGSNECIIKSISYGAENANHQKVATIGTQAGYHGTWSNVKVAATIQNPAYAIVARGTITVVTHVDNTNGGTKHAGDFLLTVGPSALSPSPETFSGSESGVVVYVNPGSYSVSEATQSGYNQAVGVGCAGTITAGDAVTCTITETSIPTTGTLTLIAEIKNDNGGTKQPSDFALFLDGISRISGSPISNLSSGSHTASANTMSGYTASPWGVHCSGSGDITINPGDNKTCIITFDDNPPAAPICAETVMMLDRTGSMGGPGSQTGTDLYNEKAAATSLVNLYAGVTPNPKIGIGIFGDGTDDNGIAPARIVSQLSTSYSSHLSAINTWLANSSGYTNLSDAINKGNGELNSVRHDPTKEKVLIVVSDGDTNRPSGSTASSTPFKLPSANIGNALPTDTWQNGAGAYGVGSAYDNGGYRHRYYNFDFGSPAGSGLPAGATFTGVELSIIASSTQNITTTTLLSDNFGTGFTSSSVSGWSEGGSGAESRASGNGNDSASPDGGRFAVIFTDSYICRQIDASSFTSLKLSYYWRGDSDANSSNDDGIVEYRTGGGCSSGSGWTQLQNHDLQNDNSWSTQSAFSLPSSLNNSTFYLRFRASSDNNEFFRVDGVNITGNSAQSCTLGADLSWNGGNNWTSEKTQTISASLSTYTFGGQNDNWGTSNWSTSSFSNSNFRVRVHNLTSGPSCNIDSLQAKIHYTISSDPVSLALNASDFAKTSGTQVYTIFFGSGNPNLLAQLASGDTPNAGHQNGSSNNLSGNPVSGNTGLLSPTSFAPPNQWTNPDRAFSSDNQYATNNINGNQQGYSNFNLNAPTSSTINGIEVTTEAKSSDSSGCQIGANLSWDNGYTWTSQKSANIGSNDATYTLGNNSDNWGRNWKKTDFDNANFLVRVQYIDPGSNCSNGSTLSLDKVQVRVSYSSIPENTDGDNFFVSPTSADMQNIFETIGAKVCPAIAVSAAPPPTTATLIIVTHIVNDDGGTKSASDFTSLVSAINPLPIGSPAGSYTGSESPGFSLTVEPGDYNIDQSPMTGYSKDLGVGCTYGNISAGETKTCIITNNDIAPSSGSVITPPPQTNITIGSWQEATNAGP